MPSRYKFLNVYIILLFVDELSLEKIHIPKNGAKVQKSCQARLEPSPFGRGTAKLKLCNIGNFAYAAYVKIGTPGYGVWLEIDTASADSWILTSTCKSSSCSLRRRFDTSNGSSTIELSNESFDLSYGRGTRVRGNLFNDRLCLSKDACLINRTLGAVTAISQNGIYSDGVLGLGLDQLVRFSRSSIQSDLSSLIQKSDSRTEQSIFRVGTLFGLSLNENTFENDEENGGELTLGYAEMSARSIKLPLVPESSGYWKTAIKKMEFLYCKNTLNCEERTGKGVVNSTKAIFDTGSTYILSSSHNLRLALDLWSKNGWVDSIDDHSLTDCHRMKFLPYLEFHFASRERTVEKLILSPVQYTFPFDPNEPCKRRVGLQFVVGLPFMVLGTAFLRNFYTVFDHGANQIELTQTSLEKTSKSFQDQFSSETHKIKNERRFDSATDGLLIILMIFASVILIPF